LTTFAWLEQARQDLRFGTRNLAASPGFTGLAVASLALGIMATTAMYSVIHAVVLDPFPYKDVHELTSVRVADAGGPGGRTSYSIDQFLEIAERSTIFAGVIASTISDVVWTNDGEPQRLRGNHVTTNTFDVLGVAPLLGRAAGAADGTPDAAPVVVLGHRFWERQFGADPGVLGRELRLNGVVRTVVGVMPRRFMWRGADVYLPTVFERGRTTDDVRFVHLLGRLKPGVTDARAEVDLRPIIADLQKTEPAQFPEQWRVSLLSFEETFPSSIRQTLWILFGAVGLLLLIACVNVSNLLLSRATARHREMAVRAALGAGRGRLVRQLLTESLLLALAGGALGVLLAHGALRAMIALVPSNTIPDEAEIAINTAVLAFTVVVSVFTAVVFGLAPAWHSSRTELADALKESGRAVSGGVGQALVRNGLVVAEVALSVMLLVGATLMMRTVLALQDVELGIRGDRLLTMRIPLPAQRYPDAERRTTFFQELLRRVAALPGVDAAALNTSVHPFGNWNVPVEVAGAAPDGRTVLLHQVSADYTKALGIPLVSGRLFDAAEVERRLSLALVNESFVRRYAAGVDPFGLVVRVPRLRSAPFDLADPSFQVVGVVKDTLNRGLTNEVHPELYVPNTLTGAADRLAVLARADPAALTAAVRAEVRALDREQPITDVRTMQAALESFVFAGPRFSLALFGVFAALGLCLAVVGVYGVVSHAVARRTQEIGVRMALGASSRRIAGMVVGSGLRLVGLGVVLGLAGSAAAARALRQLIWNVSPFDPLSFAVVSAVLVVVGIQACLRPALRASRVDPVSALRYE
jgi:putative ABC transport system permease protein